ncbi:MAG: polysaccharide biosynthesis C-terminal domain-containing protein [Proteobacteria bacterium]|nr:polysaccharide biosynthesis C-terminal domain-containing protein [Pseudomonadota bacterium]
MTLPRIVHSIVSAMGGRLATAALNYGLFWVLARKMDAGALGAFSLLTSVFLILSQMSMLGLSVALVRRAAVSVGDLPAEVSNALAFAAPISVALMLGVGACGHLSRHEEFVPAYWLVGLSLLPSAWILVAECTLLGRERVRDVTRVNFVESLFRTILSIAIVHLGHGLDGVFLAFLAGRCLSAVIYVFHPSIPVPRLGQWSAALQRRNWNEVPVFLGIAVVAALVTRLDVIVLYQTRDLRDVAIYAAASRLYDAAQMLPSVAALVIMPVLARQYVDAPERIPGTLSLTLRAGLTAGLGLTVPAAAFARPVIGLLYRPDMAGAADVLVWLTLAAAVMTIDVVLSSTMQAVRAQEDDLRALTVGLVALAVALVMLVPKFGPSGAALAINIGLTARVVMRLRWARRTLSLPSPWLYMTQAAMACAVGLGVVFATLGRGPAVAAFSGLAAYVGAAALSGALGKNFLHDFRAGMALLGRRG